MGERLDVVDDGWFREEAFDGGEGWLVAGPAALAFEGFQECGFFAADVCAGAAVDMAFDGEGSVAKVGVCGV